MKTFIKLQKRASKETPFQHFTSIVGDLRRILGSPASPSQAASFHSQDEFARAYLSYSLTRKAASPHLLSDDESRKLMETWIEAGVDGSQEPQRQLALKAFATREQQNKTINDSESWGYDPITGGFQSDQERGLNILLRAREIFQDILGSCDLDEICRMAGFGNGASASLKRAEAQREKKYLASLTGSSSILPLATLVVSSSPAWTEAIDPKDYIAVSSSGKVLLRPGVLKMSPGAVLDCVDKDAETKRIILKEPELNGYFQRGVGGVIRKRLRSYRIPGLEMLDGIDLNRTGSLNASLACAGSAHGMIGTVDGKQASDSITLSAVEFFCTPEWYRMIRMTRSDWAVTPWGRVKLQMVGGMGNGFTFELESVIFYSIGLACAERSSIPCAQALVSIHGDDLVVPSDVYNEVHAAYSRLGVVVNESKTFCTGPFRESCGGHYFMGHSVKPFYVKKQTGRLRGDWFWLANSLLLWLSERSEDFIYGHRGCDLMQIILHLRQYATNGESRKWSIGTERSRRSGLFALTPYKYRKGWPIARIVTEAKDAGELPEMGRYLVWLQHPTRVSSVLDLCCHRDSTSSEGYESVIEGEERERWVRLATFTPLSIPRLAAPLWQLSVDYNLSDF